MVSYCGKVSFQYNSTKMSMEVKQIFFSFNKHAIFILHKQVYVLWDVSFFTAMITYHLDISTFVMAISCKGIKNALHPRCLMAVLFSHSSSLFSFWLTLFHTCTLPSECLEKANINYSLGLCEETM